jgi:hemerythrin
MPPALYALMQVLQWSDSLSVRVREIDEHHKRLIGLINTLHRGIAGHHGKDVLGTILDELSDYAVYHFRTEEDYMKRFNYPGFPQHKAAHDAFIQNVTGFQKDLKNEMARPLTVMTFMNEWLITHIMDMDQGYSELFVQNGL